MRYIIDVDKIFKRRAVMNTKCNSKRVQNVKFTVSALDINDFQLV
jgi:hypothetical protein